MDPLIPLVIAVFVVLIVLVLFRSITRAYVKTPANRAFVRTGGLFRKPNDPPKVVMNGGAWVFRTIHEITWVDLGTMAIEIERTENNALLTIDPQYADIKVIFYIKVNPTVDGIVDAARTIGGKQVDANAVKQLVDAKLDGALRDVAAGWVVADGDDAALGALDLMAHGVAVLAERTSVAARYVSHGIQGTLMATLDPPLMAAETAILLSDRARRSAMGAAGRARVEREFPLRDMLSAFEHAARSARERGGERGGSRGAERAGAGGGDGAEVYDAVEKLDIPVRVVRARERTSANAADMSASPTYPGLAAHFKHGTDLPYPNLTHFIPMEAPDLVARLILEG